MNLNEPRSLRGSGLIAQSSGLNPNLRKTVAEAPAQEPSSISAVSEMLAQLKSDHLSPGPPTVTATGRIRCELLKFKCYASLERSALSIPNHSLKLGTRATEIGWNRTRVISSGNRSSRADPLRAQSKGVCTCSR